MQESRTQQPVVLPELGEGITKARVACWHVSVGDTVTAGSDVVEVVTDKATFNIEAQATGTLKAIFVDEGGEATVGETLAVIERP